MHSAEGETSPPILYHYTDQPGLLGILHFKKLWMTHHSFLNDSNEISYGKALMKRSVAAMQHRIPIESFEEWMDEFDTREDRVKDQTYIVCLSSLGDQLSQWRAYADDGVGFAIGFSNELLRNLAGDQGWAFGPDKVIYDLKSQTELMKTIDEGFAEHEGELIEFWDGLLDQHAINFKDDAFSEESEWRMSSIFIESSTYADAFYESPRPKYRSTKYGIAPYVELPVPEGSILEIVVGPRSPMRDKHWVLRNLLESNGIQNNVQLTNSSATYR